MGKKLVIVLVPMTAVPGVAVPAVGVSPDALRSPIQITHSIRRTG